jgi:hypothetical protein
MIQRKILKLEVKPNYIIEDYEDPKDVIKYVKKEIVDKEGYRNLLTLAVVKDENGGTKTVATSFWRPISKPSARRQLRMYLKKYPNKVHFANRELRKKYLRESYLVNRSINNYLCDLYE